MVSAVYECGGLKADCWNVPQVACRPECSCFSYGRQDGSTRFNLSKSASSWHKSVCSTSFLPAANRPGDCCECQDAVKYYRGDLWTEQQSRRDSSMYLSAWNDGWLPVGWEKTNNLQMDRKKSAPCVCVWVCVWETLHLQRMTLTCVIIWLHLARFFPDQLSWEGNWSHLRESNWDFTNQSDQHVCSCRMSKTACTVLFHFYCEICDIDI